MIKQLAGLALLLLLGISACNAPGKPDAQVVVVHCYQDMNAPFEPWLIKVAYEFSMTQPRTKNEKAGGPEIVSRHFLLALQKGGGCPGDTFPSFSAHIRKTRRVPQVRFLNLGLGLAVPVLSHQTRKFPPTPSIPLTSTRLIRMILLQ
jgi:hypothetical protein